MKKYILAMMLTLLSLSAAEVKENIQIPYIPYEIKMGENFDAVQTHCLTCHSFGYIINQGPQSKAFWAGKVKKMVVAFKAPMTDDDSTLVTDYLFKHYGNGKEK